MPDLTPRSPAPLLTERQQQVLVGIASGMKLIEMAHSMGISDKTVEYHISKLYEATKTGCIALATHYAIANHYVPLRDFNTPTRPDEQRPNSASGADCIRNGWGCGLTR